MFGIGFPELILIMVVALIVVGPEKLPELAKSLAKQIVELRKTFNALKESLQEEPIEKSGEKDDSSTKKLVERTYEVDQYQEPPNLGSIPRQETEKKGGYSIETNSDSAGQEQQVDNKPEGPDK